ncbi:MAG TPA: CRISPR-associated endoribonuclease Cas6 [Flavisolibacter sp.]|nr:CRISPR-associated endoribonuclease Cas6 [Flavisolibacter sp.]
MRLILKLTINKETIPFNYQPYLTGAIHKWVGEKNDIHDSLSLYSFSWLQNVMVRNNGINLTNESYFFISAYSEPLIKKILAGIIASPFVCYGSVVADVQIVNDPIFSKVQTFFTASPVFIKRRIDNNEKHITYDNQFSGFYLTETLKKKLEAANLLAEDVSVKFDNSYTNPKTKIIRYNKIGNRVNICPVIIEGSNEQLQFAWNVGIGNSTGIGFGSLK